MAEPFEEGEIPELFPGFEEELRRRRVAVTAVESRIEEVSTRVTSLSEMLEFAAEPGGLLRPELMEEITARFGAFRPRGFGTPELTRERNVLITQLEDLSDRQLRNLWSISLLEGLPLKMQQGEIESFDDFLTHPTFRLPGMTADERADAERIFRLTANAMQSTGLVDKEDATPDDIIRAMTERYRPKVALAGVHQLSTEELVKGFKARRELAPPPLDLAAVNTIYREAGISEELIKEAEDLKKMSSDYDEYWAKVLANQELVRLGLEDARMPEFGLKEQLLLAVTSPVLLALDAFSSLAKHWIYPWASTLFRGHIELHKIAGLEQMPLDKREQDFLRLYEEARATDDWWIAGGKAFEEAELGFANRLIYEWTLDPLSWLGFGMFTKVAKGIPWAGKWLGPLVGRAEFGWVKMWDVLIFDRIKSLVHLIPKTPMQAARSVAGEHFSNAIRGISASAGGRHYRWVSVDAARAFLVKARAFALKHPEDLGIKGLAGRAVLPHSAITDSVVKEMFTKLGAKAELPVSRDMLTHINVIFSEVSGHTTGKMLTLKSRTTVGTAPPLLLRALGIHETAESLKIAKTIMTTFYRGIIRESNTMLQAKSTGKLLANIFKKNQETAFKSAESLAAHNMEMTGKLASAYSHVQWKTMNIWRTTIDKWAVTPFARMYLVFAAYGPGNVLEGLIKPVFARANPAWARGVDPVVKLQNKWAGVLKPRELETAVPFVQTSPEMPSAMDFEKMSSALVKWRSWTSAFKLGDLLVDSYGRIGGKQRANYWDRLATRFLAEEEAPAVMRGLAKTVGDFVDGLPDDLVTSLRTTKKTLKIGILDNAMSGPEPVKRMIDVEIADRIAKVPKKPKVSPDEAFEDTLAAQQVQELLNNYTLISSGLQENAIRRSADGRMWSGAGRGIEDFFEDSRRLLYDEFLHSPELFESRYAELAKELISYQPVNKAEFFEKLSMMENMVNFYSESSSRIIRGAKEVADEMHIYAGDQASLLAKQQYMDDIWAGHGKYMDSGAENFNDVVKALKDDIARPTTELTTEQQDSIAKLFDMWTAEIQVHRATRAAQREAESALLSATPPGRGRNDAFWQKFRAAQHKVWDKHDLTLAAMKESSYSQQARVSTILDIAGPPPPMVDAAGRQLTKMDVATIFRGHAKDMNKAVMHMENMTLKSKLQFVTEVRAQAELMAKQAGRTADELGFTKANIESVYDQVLGDMLIDPARASVLEPQLMELASLKQELYNVFDTKGLPRGTVENMNERLAGLADDLGKVSGYAKPDAIGLSDDFLVSKQRAADKASREYFKDWADYSNETALTAAGRMLYPFWVYETHRLFWIPRNMMRFPGMFKAWGTYMSNTEDGYVHIPGTSLEINPLRGTIWMGGAIRLIRQDYPEYYDLVPGVSETLDYLSRFGFYPAAYLNTIKAVAGARSARGRPMLGELLPSFIKTPLNAYLAIHGDSEPAKALTQILVPDIYREYITMIFASRMAQDRGLDYTGRHIWAKIKDGDTLTEEEQGIWGEATKKFGLYGMLMEQGGVFRVRAEQMIDAWEESGKLIEEATGYTEEQQLWIRRHGYRVSDFTMLDPATQDLLREMDAIKYWAGTSTVLFPSSWQEEDRKRIRFWMDVEDLDADRVSDYEENERRVRAGEISFRQWRRKNSQISGEFRSDFETLKNSSEYANVPIALFDEVDDEGNVTRKGLVSMMEDRNQLPPILHPAKEILNMYYSIELEESFNPVTESWYIDWDSYFWKIDNIMDAVEPERRPDLVQQITKNMTELRRLYWQVSREYFRPYNRAQTVQLELYDTEQISQIRRFLSTPSDTERTALKEILRPDGKKLISGYQADVRQTRLNFRLLSPELDAWLLFFQITQSTKTPEALRLYEQYRRKYGIAP